MAQKDQKPEVKIIDQPSDWTEWGYAGEPGPEYMDTVSPKDRKAAEADMRKRGCLPKPPGDKS